MAYTNSSLVSYTKLSPNHSGQRTHSIDRITPHCVVGQCSVETLGNIFLPTSRQASCNYGIGVDGRVGMYVEEKNRSWCSSSSANDQRAITIECASDTTEPYAFKDVVYQKLITLCVDICKRNGKKKLLWLTDSNLNHTGIYLYSKGKIMIHLTFDYKTDEKCTTPGQYLKYHRTFQGLTTRELAEKVGIVPATLVLYENDRHPIKHDIAVALANTLGIDRNRLLDEYTTFVDYPYSSLLKKVRHELSLTQMQMAEVIGIGQTTYSGWEREARVPRRKEHDKILAALKKLKVNVDTYLCQSTSI